MHPCRSTPERRYKTANAPVVVSDTSTGQRWPIWLRSDSDRPKRKRPKKKTLEIHPAVNFTSGETSSRAQLKNAKKKHLQAPKDSDTYRENRLPEKRSK